MSAFDRRETHAALTIQDVKMHYPIRDGVLQRIVGHVRAVDGVSFQIRKGETVGLVGESGCGKTTLARMVAGLATPTSGRILYDGGNGPQPIDEMQGAALGRFRRNCQMVFQDSFASLNPRHLVVDIVGRPIKVHKEASGSALTARVVELLEQVGLGRQHLYRYPHQFSGGQRQRISIARALALNPEIIVLDEPTSALDVSVQAQILNLLADLQTERGLAYLFVTHDLSVVRHMADRLVVMYLGKIAEAGETDGVFSGPHHPYTRALMEAKPDLEEAGGDAIARGLDGVVPDPARPPRGCRFHTRCSMATPACGWEIDDVVRWLEDEPGLFDNLAAVNRKSDFAADLVFDDQTTANRLWEAMRSKRVPDAMAAALKRLNVNGSTLEIEFEEASEVPLTERDGRQAACVREPAEVAQGGG